MAPTGEEAPVVEEPAKPKRRSRAKKSVAEEPPVEQAPTEPAAEEKPKRTRRKATDVEAAAPANPPLPEAQPAPSAANDPNGDEAASDEAGTPRRGWWQRTFGE